jgi:flagellar protein FlbT
MPLNLTLKPNEKLIVNGAVVSNNSPRAVTLTFHNKAQLLQQKDVLLPEEATTPLLRTYFALQCVYLDAEGADEHRRHFT